MSIMPPPAPPIRTPPPAPPKPPIVAVDDFDRRRFRVRSVKLTAAFVTVVLSGWLFTFGTLTGVLGLLVAKHVLIAIYLMGSGIHDPRMLPPQPK
jgi:hypothetical protein